ncbi:MAG: hypothetical protein U0V87_02530 [Acidobacteriota bacterium]
MKYELKRLDPLRTANIAALVYGTIMLVIALIVVPLMLIVFAAGAAFGGLGGLGMSEAVVLIFVPFFYAILGLILGWIGGLIGSFAYNAIVRWTGGLLVEVSPVESREPTASP